MMKPRPFARIAITIPEQDLAAADRLARALDRSRSWIVAEAVRRYVEALEAPAARALLEVNPVQPSVHAVVNRDVPPRSRPGLGPSRLAQLSRDLALTPEARVRAAEETLRLTEPRDQPRQHRLLAFDRYDDFLDWKFSRNLGR